MIIAQKPRNPLPGNNLGQNHLRAESPKVIIERD
jgi:hypothetical protein